MREFVRSVISKARTALPCFFRVRLLTATTSPSTVTLPDSRVMPSMGMGCCFMLLPMMTSPVGLPPEGLGLVLTAALEAILGRG